MSAPSRGAQFLQELAGAPSGDAAAESGPAPPTAAPEPASAPAPASAPKRTLVPATPSVPLPVTVSEPSPAGGDDPGTADRAVDLAPLHLRLLMLQALRLVLAAITAGAAMVVPGPLGPDRVPALVAVSGAYALISTGFEMVRRRLRLRSAALVGGLILFDGVFLAVLMALTGGPQSVLSFLVLVHVISVTLLLSFRSGLKAALWHALLLFLASWLAQAGLIDARPGASPDQSAMLGALALLVVAVATAWFSSLNEGELRRGKAEMRALADMGARMAGSRDRNELVPALLRGVGDAFPGRRATVVLADAESRTASAFVIGRYGSLDKAATGSAGEAIVRHVLGIVDGAPAPGPLLVRALDAGRDTLLAAALPGATNVMLAPLMVDGGPVGVLAVERGGGRRTRVTARTVDLLAQFAAHAALALRAAGLQAEVERLARTDGLTGLANRRTFEDALRQALSQALRRAEPCALIVLDVDHFKVVNDTHGHQVGDAVLEQVAWALAGAARTSDLVARYGGEEFVAVLPACSGSEAMQVAERLRAAVAEQEGPVAVTMSAGVAVYPVDGGDGASLVAAADAALYKAKRQGRNRTVRFRRPRPARPHSFASLTPFGRT